MIGVLLLDNPIPRPLGDVGNPETFPFDVAYEPIPDADAARVVERGADGLLDAAKGTARSLVAAGTRALSTCCGFLAIFQRELADEVDVPVATSSLLQVPLVLATLRSDQRVCVVTINGSTLTDGHLRAAGLGDAHLSRLVVRGLEHTEHAHPVIMNKEPELDVERARAEVVGVAEEALADDPSIGAFVLECTNLPPYAAAIRAATGRPVWDATTLIAWLEKGVA